MSAHEVKLGRVAEVTGAEMDVDCGAGEVIVIDRRHNHVPVADRVRGASVVLYKTGPLDRVGFWCASPHFPDTAEGARAAIKFLSIKRVWVEFENAKMIADPSVPGVWAADLPNGRRLIVYLAGHAEYRGGPLRRVSDFEEGTR